MQKLVGDFPKLAPAIKAFNKDLKSIKQLRDVHLDQFPTGDSQKDIACHFQHLMNLLYLRLIYQLDYLDLGIRARNPEGSTVARAIIETVAAIAYVTVTLGAHITKHDYAKVAALLRRMIFNAKTKNFMPDNIDLGSPISVLDFIRMADIVMRERMITAGFPLEEGMLMTQYEVLSEFAHPNGSALTTYWNTKNDEWEYHRTVESIDERDLGLVIYTILPVLTISMVFLESANVLEKKLYGLA